MKGNFSVDERQKSFWLPKRWQKWSQPIVVNSFSLNEHLTGFGNDFSEKWKFQNFIQLENQAFVWIILDEKYFPRQFQIWGLIKFAHVWKISDSKQVDE